MQWCVISNVLAWIMRIWNPHYQLTARLPSCPHIPMMNLPREAWSPFSHLHLFWVIRPWMCLLATVFICGLFVRSCLWLWFQFPLVTWLFKFAFENPMDIELSCDYNSSLLTFLETWSNLMCNMLYVYCHIVILSGVIMSIMTPGKQ